MWGGKQGFGKGTFSKLFGENEFSRLLFLIIAHGLIQSLELGEDLPGSNEAGTGPWKTVDDSWFTQLITSLEKTLRSPKR